MASFLHFYPGLRPDDFWTLTVREYNALAKYREDYYRAMKKARGGRR